MNQLEISFGTPLRIILAEAEAPEGSALLTVRFQQFSITMQGDGVMYTLPVDHLVSMQVSYVDAGGNPARVDGAVTWASSDAAVVTVEVDANDSTMCTVTPAGALGQVQVTASADADLGAGVRTLITTCDIEIVAGEAVSGSIQPTGSPQPIAPHPAPTS